MSDSVKFEPDKFIVINRKHIDELNNLCESYPENGVCKGLRWAIEHFISEYKETVKKPLDQKYYVCNQDEPYAGEVLKVILEGEREKVVKARNNNQDFQDWKRKLNYLALKKCVALSTDDEEVLFNHFKSGTTPAEFLDPNSIPW